MQRVTRPLQLSVAALVAVATLSVPSAAFADDTTAGVLAAVTQSTDEPEATPDATTQRRRARIRRVCRRVPHLELRVGNALDRIGGDDTVRGSLAWLDSKIAQAEEADRDQLLTVLQNRRAVRAKAAEWLELRRDELANIHDLCAEHDLAE